VYFFFIKTRRATLEEIACTFDGEEAVEEIKQMALEKEKLSMLKKSQHKNITRKKSRTLRTSSRQPSDVTEGPRWEERI
jgi:hypothetical protein